MQRLHILVSISLQKGERVLTTIGPFAIDGDFDERHLDAVRKLLEKPFPWHVFEGKGWKIYFDADATSYLSGVIRGSTINVWGPWHEPNPAYKGQHKRDGHPWAIAHEVGHALDKTIQKSSRNFRDDIHEVMHDGAPYDHMRSTRDVPAPDEPNPDGLHGWNSSGRTPHDAAAGEAFAEWFAWMLGYVTTGKLSHGKHTWYGEDNQEAIQDIVDDAIITELESRDTDPKEPETPVTESSEYIVHLYHATSEVYPSNDPDTVVQSEMRKLVTKTNTLLGDLTDGRCSLNINPNIRKIHVAHSDPRYTRAALEPWRKDDFKEIHLVMIDGHGVSGRGSDHEFRWAFVTRFNGWEPDVILHEIFHSLGAVEIEAPRGDPSGHARDGDDLMAPSTGYRLDVEGDSYFSFSPQPDGWLKDHPEHNLALSPFLRPDLREPEKPDPEPEPEEPKEPMPTEPDTTDVNIKGKKFELTGTNIYRSRDTLVLYTRTEHQSFVPTNRWGIEVVVRDGVIVDIVNRLSTGAKAPEIPENGYVLSGHGKGYDWLSRIASIGDIVSSPGHEREVPAVEEKPRIPDSVIRKLEEIRKSVDDLILEIKSY